MDVAEEGDNRGVLCIGFGGTVRPAGHESDRPGGQDGDNGEQIQVKGAHFSNVYTRAVLNDRLAFMYRLQGASIPWSCPRPL